MKHTRFTAAQIASVVDSLADDVHAAEYFYYDAITNRARATFDRFVECAAVAGLTDDDGRINDATCTVIACLTVATSTDNELAPTIECDNDTE